jgi:hypothetical protein
VALISSAQHTIAQAARYARERLQVLNHFRHVSLGEAPTDKGIGSAVPIFILH